VSKLLSLVTVSIILIINACSAQAIQSSPDRLLRQAFPDLQAKQGAGSYMTYMADGKEYRLNTYYNPQVQAGDKTIGVMVVEFPDEGDQSVNTLTDHGKLVAPQHTAMLLIYDPVANALIKKITVDKRAISLSGCLETADFMGNGTTQAKITAGVIYGEADPTKLYQTERVYLFSLPVGEPLLALTTKRLVISTDSGGPLMKREMTFKDLNGDGINDIELLTTNMDVLIKEGRHETVERSTVSNARGHFTPEDDKPWERWPSDVVIGLRKLQLQVMDEAGKPMGGISVRIEIITTLLMESKTIEKNMTTDDNGNINLTVDGRVNYSINSTGYVPLHKLIELLEIPEGVVQITLVKTPPPVSMARGRVGDALKWGKELPIYEAGIKFPDEPGETPSSAFLVNEKDKASIWIQACKTTKWKSIGDKGEWTISIEGVNGWDVAPGPKSVCLENDPLMMIAPTDGYMLRIEHKREPVGEGVFIRHAGSNRYGKIFNYYFSDMTPIYEEKSFNRFDIPWPKRPRVGDSGEWR
jgi:hypothetical protein